MTVRDGKTGAELLNELFTDKRFLPYLESLGVTWKGTVHARELPGAAANPMTLNIEPEGEHLLPFFQRHRLVMDMNFGGPQTWVLRLLDRASGEEGWRQPNLPAATYFVSHLTEKPPRFAFAAGHTLILHLNQMVYAYNLPEHKELWHYSLFNAALNVNGQNRINLDNDGQVSVIYQDGREEKLGSVGLVSPSYVILMTRDGLVADPNRPGPSKLWTKTDVSMRAHLFGDDEHVYIVEAEGENHPPSVRAIAPQDGVTVPVANFGPL